MDRLQPTTNVLQLIEAVALRLLHAKDATPSVRYDSFLPLLLGPVRDDLDTMSASSIAVGTTIAGLGTF
ncbi:MAG: hypothetical protein ACRYGK_19470 [Janthinobacterium lividum]